MHTEIVAYNEFYLAEGYHQKYQLQGNAALAKEFAAIYPNETALVNSTAAARVNGYLGGYGSAAQLNEELDALGLSPEGQRALRQRVGSRGR